MIGCCWCTTSKCYQDKDAIEYYVGGNSKVSTEFKASIQRESGQMGIGDSNDRHPAPDGKLIR